MSFMTRNRCRRAAALIAAACFFLAPAAQAQGKSDKTPPSAPPTAAPKMDAAAEKAMMDMMMKLATPGPQHAQLMKKAGTWKTVTKAWMGPGDPTVSEGSATYTPILGGRFLEESVKGTFNNMPFEGFGITGYDNQHQEYVNVWMDTLGTAATVSRGKMDASGKVLTMNTEFEDPTSGKKAPMRMVTKFVDDDHQLFEVITNYDGKDVKELEVTYSRIK